MEMGGLLQILSLKSRYMNVITFGTFDLFHVGHLRILKRAAEMGNRLIVGVSSDALNFSKKSKNPVFSQNERIEIVSSIRYVEEVFLEESLEAKRDYILNHKADILIMGDDWKGRFDHLEDVCKVVYLERTPSISTTQVIEVISNVSE